MMKTKIVANINPDGIPDFTANGSRMISLGWLACDVEAQGEDVDQEVIDYADLLFNIAKAVNELIVSLRLSTSNEGSAQSSVSMNGSGAERTIKR